METRPQIADVADLLSYWLAVFPPRTEQPEDQAALLRAFWGVVQPRPWLTVEMLMRVAENVLTHNRYLPTPAEFLDYCVALKPRDEEPNRVDAARLLADLKAAEGGPSSLAAAVANGQWDRGAARGRLLGRLGRSPTTAELDEELGRPLCPFRGPPERALLARLAHCPEGYR